MVTSMTASHTLRLALLVALVAVTVVLVVVGSRARPSLRTGHAPAADGDTDLAEEASARPLRASESARAAVSARGDDPGRREATRRPSSQALFRAVRETALSAALSLQGTDLESMTSQMDPYLVGMVQAMKAIDPALVRALADDLADDICRHRERNELDLMLYSKLAILEPALGSSRGLECALEHYEREDVVLWSLLDAWNAGGRAPLAVLPAIERHASDERTRRRLLPIEEQRRARLAHIAAEIQGGQVDDRR